MLVVETVVRIRREHASGKAIKAIARDLRLSRKVVRKAIRAPGQSYAARPGGGEASVEGDAPGTMVSLERLASNSLRETYTRDGKVVRVTTMTIADDGLMSGVSEDKVQGSTIKYSARKK